VRRRERRRQQLERDLATELRIVRLISTSPHAAGAERRDNLEAVNDPDSWASGTMVSTMTGAAWSASAMSARAASGELSWANGNPREFYITGAAGRVRSTCLQSQVISLQSLVISLQSQSSDGRLRLTTGD
jgi:hypothetical protein